MLKHLLGNDFDSAVEAAIEATKEKAAKVCDEYADSAEGWGMEEGGYDHAISFCEQCAAAIRSMK